MCIRDRDNFTLKLHNSAYSGAGVGDPQGTIAKILFNTTTYNGWNAYGAIALDTLGASSAKGDLVFSTANSSNTVAERVRIGYQGLMGPIPRTGTWDGTYVYRQINQGQTYKHYIRGPKSGYISTELGDNYMAYVTIQVLGTGSDNCYCYYRITRDASTGANQVVVDHIRGNNGSGSNFPYMELYNGEAAWLMDHATQYYVIVRVEVTGGSNGVTYTSRGEYGSN